MDADSVSTEKTYLCDNLEMPEIEMDVRQYRNFDHVEYSFFCPLYSICLVSFLVVFKLITFACVEYSRLEAEIWHITEHLAI